ncbi:hypothetical protein CR513_17285, partial [Mucuna pruriens]
MEMSNLAAKLKSLKLELGEDLIVDLKSRSLNVFKSFKAEVELQLGKKIKAIKSDRGGEYYGRYDGSREQRPRPFKECGIVPQYTMSGKPSMNDATEHSQGYKFYDPTSRSFFETRNARFLEKDEFRKEENIRNVDFEEEFDNDIDYDEVFPQTPIEQPQQLQELSLRRFIKERRHVVPDDYVVFL